MTVVEDVDVETFSTQAEEFFNENYEGATLELYTSIRESAGS